MDFLYTCINLIKYEKVVQELQHLVRQYEMGKIDPMLSRVVNQVSRKRRTNKELHLSAQIGDDDVDYVVLNLVLEVYDEADLGTDGKTQTDLLSYHAQDG
jgi:hypothetical protein